MKDNELEEQIEAIRRDWVDELLQANAVEFDKEIKYLIAQERRKAKIDGFNEGWAKNVQSSLCFMHEHDVRWCDECRGELKEDKEA